MSVTSITPYLFFNGNAEQVIGFYETVFGTQAEGVMRFGDHDQACPEADKRRILHAMLRIGQATIMFSDTPFSKPIDIGANVHLAVNFETAAELDQTYEALSAGGTVLDKPHDAFWGDRFGVLRDPYGVFWMLTARIANQD